MLVTKKEPRIEKLPHRRGKCVSQQEGNRGAICSSSVKIPALAQVWLGSAWVKVRGYVNS